MEIKEKLEQMGHAFEEFKKTNDARNEEIKKFGTATAATETKLKKVEEDMDKLQKSIDQMNAALNRSGGLNGGDEQGEQKKASAAYKKALSAYMKKGIDMPHDVLAAEPEYKDMQVGVDADGGYLVSPETSSEIVKKIYESSPMRQLASVMTIGTDSLEMLYDGGEAGASWVGETQARPKTDTPQLKKIVIPVNELYANPAVTQKLLDDAAVNIEAWLADKVREVFARKENTAFISGDGVLKPKGIFAYDSGTGFNQIERVETAANNAVTGDDLLSLQIALKEGYQGNASWLINRLQIGAIRKLKDSQGAYIWQPGLQAGVPNLLLGRPMYMAADLPSSITATTDHAAYGDFRAGYQIVDRFGIRVLRDPYTAKPFVLFYTTKRVGGGVKDFDAIKILRIKT
jgi:HK97 family phage major capsid protein